MGMREGKDGDRGRGGERGGKNTANVERSERRFSRQCPLSVRQGSHTQTCSAAILMITQQSCVRGGERAGEEGSQGPGWGKAREAEHSWPLTLHVLYEYQTTSPTTLPNEAAYNGSHMDSSLISSELYGSATGMTMATLNGTRIREDPYIYVVLTDY